MSKTRDNNDRVWLLRLGGIYLIIALAFVAILVKVLYLQIARHDSELEKQNKRIIQERSYQAKRGNIYASTGEPLAFTYATDKVYINPLSIETDSDKEIIAQGLGAILGVDSAQLLVKLKETIKF